MQLVIKTGVAYKGIHVCRHWKEELVWSMDKQLQIISNIILFKTLCYTPKKLKIRSFWLKKQYCMHCYQECIRRGIWCGAGPGFRRRFRREWITACSKEDGRKIPLNDVGELRRNHVYGMYWTRPRRSVCTNWCTCVLLCVISRLILRIHFALRTYLILSAVFLY